MRVDDSAISQDESGYLRAGRLIAFSNLKDKSVNRVGWDEYNEWIQSNQYRFAATSQEELRTLKGNVIDGSYELEEVHDIYGRFFDEDPGEAKSIAQKTGNTSEFTDDKGTNAVDKEFSVDIYRVLPEEQGEDFDGNMLGFAVDFPNSDVYVEWNNKIFPDPLDDGHVSIYSSLEDLEKATSNQTELIETVSQPDTVEKSSIEKQMIEGYPDLPLDDTPEEVVNWLHRLDADYNPSNESEALLYQLLGSGTPEWKMSKEDADYKDEPEGDAYCGNCEYAYYSNQSGRFICSKIRGKVDWEGWCRLWDYAESDPLLEEEFGVPDGVDKSLEKGEHLEEVIIGGQTLTLEVADDDASRHIGLSKYESLDDIDGMVFRYPREEAHRLVWRDMSFPVDVIHLDNAAHVVAKGSIEGPGHFVQAKSKIALEVPHGFVEEYSVEKGDEVVFDSTVQKGRQEGDNLFEKFVGGSYHRARKLQEQGEQVSIESLERIDEAFREQVWPDEIQKSPSWQDDADVDDETQEWVEAVLDMKDPMFDEYDGVPMAAGISVKQEIRDSITQPQGWSLDSIVDRLDQEFPKLDDFNKRRIARQEVAGLLNSSKMIAIEARKGDPLVRWVGPGNQDSTELCKSLEQDSDGGVPFSEFKEMLTSHANEYESGTPRRAEQGLPHFMCRYTVELVEE